LTFFLLGESGTEDDRPALFEAASGTRLSYWQLRQQVVAQIPEVAASEAKSLVFLFCRNDLSTVITYIAAVESGQAVTLLDANLNSELRDALIERYRPELVAGCGENLVGYEASPPTESGLTLQRRRADESGPPLHPELAVLLSTSGSTGSPKLVRLTQAAVEANADSIRIALRIDRDERPVSSLPLHYSYGLSILNSHLVAGAELVLTSDGILTEEFWQVVRDRGCTSFAGVPYSYQLLKRLELGRLLPATLKTLTQAGGKLADPLIDHYHSLMKERGGSLYVMYGQTEAAPRITTLPAEHLHDKLGSVGLPLAGGSLHIEVDGSTATNANVVGEVVYRGPNVMMGYALHREDLKRGDELHGELRTGDLGYLDDEGYLFVTGRIKRIAKVFGLRINLEELEAMIRPQGPAAVLGTMDRLTVFCEFGDDETFVQLRRELAERLAIHHSAFVFLRIDALPLNSNGKVDYRALDALGKNNKNDGTL
jgi:acyl-CoA synthetase (AMP-forming)/AMP-acid ligase II